MIQDLIITLLQLVLAVPIGVSLAFVVLAVWRALGRALRAAALRVGARPQPTGPAAVAAQLAALQRAKAARLAATEPEYLDEEIKRLRTLIEKLAPSRPVG